MSLMRPYRSPPGRRTLSHGGFRCCGERSAGEFMGRDGYLRSLTRVCQPDRNGSRTLGVPSRPVAEKSKAPIVIAVVIVGVLVGLPLGAWFGRGVLATSIARGELERRGFTCDDRFAVSLSAALSEATIGPTRCEHAGGVLEAIELLGDLRVELDGTEPTSVEADSLRLALRSASVRGGEGWADALRRVNLEQQMAGVIKGLSELSRMDLPRSTVESVEIVRDASVLGRAQQVALAPGDPLGVTVGRVHFEAGPMGVGQLDLTDLVGTATGAAVTLRGQAHARAGVAIILTYERSGPFTLEATGLDTASPRFRLDSDL